MAAPPLLLRSAPVLRLRLHLHLRLHHRLFAGGLRPLCAAAGAGAAADASTEPASPEEKASSEDKKWGAAVLLSTKEPPRYQRWDDPDFRKWKDKEDEILRDIEPTVSLAKEILHSDRYLDGERLTAEDEKTVVEKLLIYHPHAEDKIGCGLDYIMLQAMNYGCIFVGSTYITALMTINCSWFCISSLCWHLIFLSYDITHGYPFLLMAKSAPNCKC